MGIQLYDDEHDQGWDVTTAVITDIQDNTIYFDNRTVNDYVASLNGTITNSFSVIEAVDVENVRIADFVVEGNKNTNDYINGCRGGGIYIHKSKNCLVENVKINEFNGDTFSWQITEKITIRGCEASNGDGLGYHPGTGSDHSIIENCISHHNKGDGIFLCWRVQNGIFRNNTVYGNGDNGISIGHKDTDNFFEDNHVYENGSHGVLFRNENEQNSGHRNTFVNNNIENNGISRESAGFYIGGETRDIRITSNIIRSAGKGNQSVAIFIGKKSSKITATDNDVSGSKAIVYEK
jgi:parallel beta-helix repeat protein